MSIVEEQIHMILNILLSEKVDLLITPFCAGFTPFFQRRFDVTYAVSCPHDAHSESAVTLHIS